MGEFDEINKRLDEIKAEIQQKKDIIDIQDITKKYKLYPLYNRTKFEHSFMWYLVRARFRDCMAIWHNRRLLNRKERTVMVLMLLKSGKFLTFLVHPDERKFTYKEQDYIFDTDYKENDIATNLDFYTYYEGCSLPLKWNIPETTQSIEQIMKEGGKAAEVAFNIYPDLLHKWNKASIIGQMINAISMMEVLRTLLIIVVIGFLLNLMLGGFNLYYGYYNSKDIGITIDAINKLSEFVVSNGIK